MQRLGPPGVLVAISLLLCAFFGIQWQRAEQRVRSIRHWTSVVLDSLGSTVTFPRPPDELGTRDSLYWVWTATVAQLQSRRWQQAIRHTWLAKRTMFEPSDELDLRRAGLVDPANQLRDSLVAHPELIPFPGVLGGRMGFYDREGITLLDRPFVFATFDDGHIGGSMLLEYVTPGQGTVIWKRLWARRE
jgi:hypothetical protein